MRWTGMRDSPCVPAWDVRFRVNWQEHNQSPAGSRAGHDVVWVVVVALDAESIQVHVPENGSRSTTCQLNLSRRTP